MNEPAALTPNHPSRTRTFDLAAQLPKLGTRDLDVEVEANDVQHQALVGKHLFLQVLHQLALLRGQVGRLVPQRVVMPHHIQEPPSILRHFAPQKDRRGAHEQAVPALEGLVGKEAVRERASVPHAHGVHVQLPAQLHHELIRLAPVVLLFLLGNPVHPAGRALG